MNQLTDKVAVITGVGSGIGKATAQLFALQGARVAGLDFNALTGEEAIQSIRDAGNEALFIQTDVERAEQIESAMLQTADHFGRVDILVNVVGVSGRRWGDGPTAECTEEAWDKLMDINLKSVFLCCKYALQDMLKRDSGTIVNISSVLGLVGGDADFGTHAYATTKGAIISLTRSIASYYAPRHIRANAICPGLIATNMSKRAQTDEYIRNRLTDLQPLTGDFGQPEDVAQAALYFASDNSAFVTGAVLTVDGGWTTR
jgi:NAD(P)-dependent dehydrogenase (short-subunit alcohol dehydrogenase family)